MLSTDTLRNGFEVVSIRNSGGKAAGRNAAGLQKASHPDYRDVSFDLLDETDSLENLLGFTQQFLVRAVKNVAADI